jgi:nucleoside-triphosphatase THEP1
MAKVDKDTLQQYGEEFQIRLIKQILHDNKFANTIIDIVDANYFHDPYMRIMVASIKQAKAEHDIIPDIGALEIRMLEGINEDSQRKYTSSLIKKINDSSLNDSLFVQDRAMKFCKQQELKKSIREIQKIIDKGNVDDYEKCENIIKKAIEHGDNKDDGLDIFENITAVLQDDFRKPIRTGIDGLDEVMDGGLAKGELGIILAPFGVGKTTMITKLANTAVNDGHNVLQIFFEDLPKVIQRKHLACWTGIKLNDLSLHKEKILEMCADKLKNSEGKLRLKKFPSDGTTIPIIRQYIRKKIAEGFKPDVVLLDYIDCVQPSKVFDDVYAGEGNVMRQFESMLAEFDLVGWTAVQGNRSSIKADVVEADQMGGSIKKGQIGHFIVSIAKTLDQKEAGTATMAILKSRFGKDGIIFSDIKFDNASIQIDMGSTKGPKTQVDHRREVETSQQERISELFTQSKARKAALES